MLYSLFHPFKIGHHKLGYRTGFALLVGTLASCGGGETVTDAGSQGGTAGGAIEADSADVSAIVPAADRPQVVTTVNILCDLIQQLTQPAEAAIEPPIEPTTAPDAATNPLINLTCLLDRAQDPHAYQPTPSDRRTLADADLVLYGGYGLEAGLIQLIKASNTPAIAVYEQAVPEPLQGTDSHNHGEEQGGDDHGHGEEADAHDYDYGDADAETPGGTPVDEPQGAVDGEQGADREGDPGDPERLVPDPHVWQDAAIGGEIIAVLAAELAAIVPSAADTIQNRATVLQTELNSLDRWIQAQVDTIPANQRTLVTTHDAFRYFGQAYGLDTWGILSGLSPNQKPTAATLATLADRIQASAVPVVFPEQGMDSSLLTTVAETAGVPVGAVPLGVESLGEMGSDRATYQQFLVVNTCAIVTGLGGTCTPFSP